MIDWFPPGLQGPARITDPQTLRWRSMVGLRDLAREIDGKHPATAAHSERVARLAVALAAALGWTAREQERLGEAALVHDVGKVCVPDVILEKDGPLTAEEYAVVRTHAGVGASIVRDTLDEEQTSWVLSHHERWDGAGYPAGLTRSQIPAGALVLALADSWDAMTTRPSDGALSHAEALEECAHEAGGQFAPWVVAALPLALRRLGERTWPRVVAPLPVAAAVQEGVGVQGAV
jgi:putative nucleotidyltransferase with HDIG domain